MIGPAFRCSTADAGDAGRAGRGRDSLDGTAGRQQMSPGFAMPEATTRADRPTTCLKESPDRKRAETQSAGSRLSERCHPKPEFACPGYCEDKTPRYRRKLCGCGAQECVTTAGSLWNRPALWFRAHASEHHPAGPCPPTTQSKGKRQCLDRRNGSRCRLLVCGGGAGLVGSALCPADRRGKGEGAVRVSLRLDEWIGLTQSKQMGRLAGDPTLLSVSKASARRRRLRPQKIA